MKKILANPFPLLSLAPYERRVIELLRNSKDKRARKLAKKRVRFPLLPHIPPRKYHPTPRFSFLGSPLQEYPRDLHTPLLSKL